MNRTININLGGFSFVIDEDAYGLLKNYFSELGQYFSSSQGSEDIVADIEYRMAELLKEQMGAREVVNKQDVTYAIERLGKPEVFESDWVGDDDKYYSHSDNSGPSGGAKKKLWRNPEEKIIAGVCSGLSAYFGISDPVWIRLLFVVIFFSGGAGILIYLILWLIVPEAKSAADRLSMKGENIDIENIAREVESTLQRLGEKIYDLGKNIQPDKKKHFSKTEYSRMSGGLSLFFRNLFQLLGTLFKFLTKTLLLILLFALGLAFSGMLIALFLYIPILNVLLPFSSIASILLLLGASLLIVIPVIYLLIWAGDWTSDKENTIKLRSFSAFLWICCLFTTITAGIQTHSSVAVTAHSLEKITIDPSPDTLTLIGGKKDYSSDKQIFDLIYSNGEYYVENVKIHLKISPDEQLHIIEKKLASGKNKDEAIEFGNSSEYQWIQKGNSIQFPSSLLLPSGLPYKRQRIEIDIEVPKNTYLNLDKEFQQQLLTSIAMKHGEKINKRLPYNLLFATENGFSKINE